MTMNPEQLLEITQATLKAAEFCFLITLGESGQAEARLMQPFEPEPDLTIWFGTSPTSRKVREIQKDNRVTLGYTQAQAGAYVTLIGTASIEDDTAKKQHYWREDFAAFWPVGPMSEAYSLIKFVPSRIELMHIGQEVAPEPFGLKPVILIRAGEGWELEEGNNGT